jgi:hypothetical protein
MPENETLFPDARTASRWQPLKERIAGGESPNQIFPDFEDEFYSALRRVFKEWAKHGVNPKEMFEAALNKDCSVLRDLVNQVWNHDYARLLQNATSANECPDLESVLRLFINSAWDRVRDLLQIDCREGGIPDAFLKRVDQMLGHLVRGLLGNPSRIPPRPHGHKRPPDLDDTLSESLPVA